MALCPAGYTPSSSATTAARARRPGSISSPGTITTRALRRGRRLLSLWGATFEGGPVGLELAPPCAGDRTLRLGVRAGAATVYLLWGGHLAASADWGAGLGATDADQPFAMAVQVFGVTPNQRAVLISPGSLSR